MVTSATYAKDPITNENICVNAIIDGVNWSVPLDNENAHYQEIRGGPHSGATSYTMVLPHVPPTANQVLTTASISSNVAVLDWADAASGGVDTTGTPANNQIATFTDTDTLQGEAELTYVSGSLTMNHDSGAAIINLDASSGQSQVKLRNAGTTKWEVGIDGDGSGNQKSHVDDFAFYNDSYGVVISGNGSNKFGIGTQAGIELSGQEIPEAGIQFPATETLSTSPNNMDVYEEGTWTPVIQFGNTASSFTYGTQTGYYTRIGRMILIHGRLDVTGGSTGSTGNAKISGLPWQSNVTPASHSAASIGYMAGFSFANQATLMIQSGSTYLDYMETTESGTVSHLTHSNFTTSHQLFFSGLYFDV